MDSTKKNSVLYFLMADTVILCLSILLAMYYNGESFPRGLRLSFMMGLPTLWFFIVYWQRLYIPDLYEHDFRRLIGFIKSCSILVFLLGLVYVFFAFPPKFRNTIVAFSIGFPLCGILGNFIIISVINRLGYASKKAKNTLLINCGEHGVQLNAFHHPYSLATGTKVQNGPPALGETNAFENIQFMKDYMEDHHVDEIILNLPVPTSQAVKDILHIADYHGTRVKIQPDYGKLSEKIKMGASSRAVNVRPMPLDNTFSNFLKETFDFVFASVALIFLLPVFLIIAVLIKLDSPRPVFYCPIRVGKANRPFKLYKFSTMKESDPVNGGTNSTLKDDPRITKLGKIMRKYSIDELPQFLNVFLGDMSVVGPRPHRTHLNEQFQKSQDNYMIRHYYKPGITGWAQVNGWRGPTTTDEQKYQRTVHDLWYLENWSFKVDLKIIYMTVFGSKVHKSAF